jgi:acylphosphatase
MSEHRVARRYLIHGRVQGVGYRWWAQKSASLSGVDGYTRNLDDGSVEVYAVGTPHQLDNLAGYLRKGPRLADVRGVEEREAAVEKLRGFSIRG